MVGLSNSGAAGLALALLHGPCRWGWQGRSPYTPEEMSVLLSLLAVRGREELDLIQATWVRSSALELE